MDTVLVKLLAQLDFILTVEAKPVNHVLLIVLNVTLKMSATLVSKDLSLLNFHGEELKPLTALKSAVMERDSSLTAMMETQELVMVAMTIVRLKRDGLVKVDQALRLALALNMLHQDHSLLLLELSTYLEESFKVLDSLTFLQL